MYLPSVLRTRPSGAHAPLFSISLFGLFNARADTNDSIYINISGRRAPPQMRYIIAAENYIKLFVCAHFPARGIKMWERAPGAIELPASDICMHRVTFSSTRLFGIGSFNAGKEKLNGFLRCSLSNGILDQWGIIYIYDWKLEHERESSFSQHAATIRNSNVRNNVHGKIASIIYWLKYNCSSFSLRE